MRRSVAGLLAGLAVVAGVGACSSGDDDATAERSTTTSTEEGAAPGSGGIKPPVGGPEPVADHPEGLSPIEAPGGFSRMQGEGFTIAVPEGFARDDRTSSNGEPLLVFTTGGPVGSADEQLVGVLRDVKRGRAGALEQSSVLESSKRLVTRATGVRRTVVSWPGVRDAVLVEWTEQKPLDQASTATKAVRHVQLFADVDDRLSLAVVALAPAETFDASRVATALRTFRPAGAAT